MSDSISDYDWWIRSSYKKLNKKEVREESKFCLSSQKKSNSWFRKTKLFLIGCIKKILNFSVNFPLMKIPFVFYDLISRGQINFYIAIKSSTRFSCCCSK